MFTDFFYLLRKRGIKVSLNEWMMLLEALDKGLCRSSLTEFYYLCRAILIKSEADFDKYDLIFSEFFKGIESIKELPQDLRDWLNDIQPQQEYDKEEVDRRNKDMTLEKIRKMMEERLEEQKERHDGGSYWIGTGGTSVFGNSGYNPTGIRVEGEGGNRRALQVAGERNFRDFREDRTLNERQFQLALRRLRQFTTRQDGPKDTLDLDQTIQQTCNNGGNLKIVLERPRINSVKLLVLFDSGGSMWPYTTMCNSLFQAVSKSNHFKDLKVYYFHNCFYESLYTDPGCSYSKTIETEWVLKNLDEDYKVIVVGDAAMEISELTYPGGANFYNHPNERPGIEWIERFKTKYDKMIWLNPISEQNWDGGYGYQTIQLIKRIVPMYHLTVKGLEEGLKNLLVRK